MNRIDRYSRLHAEFTLQWKSLESSHKEVLWSGAVSVWRDVLEPRISDQLVGKTIGESAQVEIPADCFYAPYKDDKKIRIQSGQFSGVDHLGQAVTPVPGRFYPQGMIHGVSGIFRQSITPCRFLGSDGDFLVFDCNHPLAGRDLVFGVKVLAIDPVQKERGGRCEDWLERVTSDGPGMQARYDQDDSWALSPANFYRKNEYPDHLFYQKPRMVHHLDSTAREIIGRHYTKLIPANARVLDLMGSWSSHLPDHCEVDWLTVLGLNEVELQHNQRADDVVVQDLNMHPILSFSENSFDAVICTASVEYLTDPLHVLAELKRVLQPGGVVAFSFSNRWFPPKAIAVWQQMHEFERVGWVAELIHQAGGFGEVSTFSYRGRPRPADDPHQDVWLSDPVYVVWAKQY